MPETPASAVTTPPPGRGDAVLTLETALAATRPVPSGGSQPAPRPGRAPMRLRTNLWLLLAIGLLPALAGTVWYLVQLRQTALRDAYAQTDLMAAGSAEALRWVVQDAQAMLESVAARPRVRALDPADCDAVFSDFRTLVPAYKALALRRIEIGRAHV